MQFLSSPDAGSGAKWAGISVHPDKSTAARAEANCLLMFLPGQQRMLMQPV